MFGMLCMSFAASCRIAGVKNNLINAPGADTIIGWTIRMFKCIGTIINSNQFILGVRNEAYTYMCIILRVYVMQHVTIVDQEKNFSLPIVTSTLSGELFTVLEYPDNSAACYVRQDGISLPDFLRSTTRPFNSPPWPRYTLPPPIAISILIFVCPRAIRRETLD